MQHYTNRFLRLINVIVLVALFIANTGFAQVKKQNEKNALRALMMRSVPCRLEGAMAIIDTSWVHVANAAYAYNYVYPRRVFNEVYDKDAKNIPNWSDTARYKSTDGLCSFKCWPGKTLDFPLGVVNPKTGKPVGITARDVRKVEQQVDLYIDSLKSGREKFAGAVSIKQLKKGISGYYYQIALIGTQGHDGIIYKIDVSELPVSGDLIFKHFLYRYQLSGKEKYQPIGIAMANNFKAPWE